MNSWSTPRRCRRFVVRADNQRHSLHARYCFATRVAGGGGSDIASFILSRALLLTLPSMLEESFLISATSLQRLCLRSGCAVAVADAGDALFSAALSGLSSSYHGSLLVYVCLCMRLSAPYL